VKSRDNWKAKVIITATRSGYTARAIARRRPVTPILAVTSSDKTQRRLALVWGIQSALVQETASTDGMISRQSGSGSREGVAESGDLVVITAAFLLRFQAGPT